MDKVSLSVINLILEADVVVKFVMLVLAIVSLWSWSIIFEKFFLLNLVIRRVNGIEKMFDKGNAIDEIQKSSKKDAKNPLNALLLACMREWRNNNVKQIMQQGVEKKQSLKERLSSAMEIACNKSIAELESGLSFLAIAGSCAPFVGLFGTVWGIMTSFQNIAIAKNTNLAVVAPGIAEALLATGIGLFAAIPAVFFYNIFTNKINQIHNRSQNFSGQILNLLSKELDN
jgi:biopolymer transport protein TolQ